MELLPITILLVTLSSVACGSAGYLVTRWLVAIMDAPAGGDMDQWHHEQARRKRLRESSQIYRAIETCVVALATVIQTNGRWFIEVPSRHDVLGRMLVGLFTCVFGRPKKLASSVQILMNAQPWSEAEVVATGWIVGAAAGAVLSLNSLGSMSTLGLVGCAAAVMVVVYRAWIWHFVSQAELRRRAIRRFLPHAMDSIAMVISSGDPFRSGLDTVVRDFPDHPLSQELARLRSNLDRGQTMEAALTSTAQAVCLPEFDELVRILGRIHKHGAPATESFTRMAKQLRITQLRYMEEEVGRAEASMALPVMCVTFACIVVAAGPFLLSMIRSAMMQ